jgi:hypothetical protein
LAFLVLLLIALLTHAYLFVMVSLIFATALLGRLLCGRDVREPAIYGGLIAAIVVAAGWASGYIGYADLPGTVDSNFGHYSMNLLAPISPVQDGQILPRQADATGGQYEGINYLGAGIIVLLLIAVPGQIRRLPALAWTRVGPLVGGLSLLTALAVSNRIYLGERLLWTYEIPSSLSFITVFRSSGRFFWPVCYAAIAFAVVSTLDSRRRRSLTAALMVVGLALQLYDTTTNRAYLRDGAGTEHGASAAEGGLRAVASRHRRLAMVPPVQCMERRSTEFWAASRVAAGLGISIHSFVAARYAPSVPEDCRQLMNSVRERGFDQGTLYILNKSTARSVSVRPELAEHCGTLEMFILCTLDREAVSGMAALEPSVSHWPLIDGMAGPTELRNVLGWGWSNENAVGVWAVGRSEILFRSDGACADVEALVLRIGAFVPEGPSRVEISINDMPVLVETYPEGDPRTVTVPLDACDAATGLVRATFDAERVISPIEAGVSGDPRPLGVYLLGAELIDSRRTAVSERIEVQPANLQVGDSYVLRIPAVQDTRVEIRYRLNDGQEETFEATLDDDGGVEFLVSNSTRRGIYEFLAYRVGTGPWRTVAATATVR